MFVFLHSKKGGMIILTSQVLFTEAVKNAHPDIVGGTAGIIMIPQQKNDVSEARHIVLLAQCHDIGLPCRL